MLPRFPASPLPHFPHPLTERQRKVGEIMAQSKKTVMEYCLHVAVSSQMESSNGLCHVG